MTLEEESERLLTTAKSAALSVGADYPTLR